MLDAIVAGFVCAAAIVVFAAVVITAAMFAIAHPNLWWLILPFAALWVTYSIGIYLAKG